MALTIDRLRGEERRGACGSRRGSRATESPTRRARRPSRASARDSVTETLSGKPDARQIHRVRAARRHVFHERAVARPEPHVVADASQVHRQRRAPAAGAEDRHASASDAALRAAVRCRFAARSTFERCLKTMMHRRGDAPRGPRAPGCRARTRAAGARLTRPPIRARCISSARRPRRRWRAPAESPAASAPRRRRRRSRRLCRRGTGARRDRCGRRSPRAPRPPAAAAPVLTRAASHTLAAPFAMSSTATSTPAVTPDARITFAAPRLPLPTLRRSIAPHRRASISAKGIDPMR